MGFFAIIHPKLNQEQFKVKRCHLNLFVLRSRLGFYDLLWDVGVLFEKAEQPAPPEVDVQIALPFGTTVTSFEDLSSKVLDQSLATQVFGESVVVDKSKLTVPSYGESFTVVAVTADRKEKFCDRDRSIWEFKVALSASTSTYVRIRFKVAVPDRIWQWQPSTFIRDGALVDLRISDVRGAGSDSKGTTSSDWMTLSERIAVIPYLNAFVVVPVALRLGAAFPQVKYARLLEPSVWERYLRRTVRGKLAIYHWKVNEAPGVSRERPFQAYLDLRSGTRGYSFLELLRLVIATTLFLAALTWAFDVTPAWLQTGITKAKSAYLLSVPGLAFVMLFVARVKFIIGTVTWTREWFRGKPWRREW